MKPLALLLAALALTGCSAPAPDLEARAAADFDALVRQAGEVDAAVLRTLEREQPTLQPCGPGSARSVHVAAGMLSITADDDAGLAIVDDLASGLDPDRWNTLEAAADDQRAFVDADGIVVTLTFDDGLVLIAVFGACRQGM